MTHKFGISVLKVTSLGVALLVGCAKPETAEVGNAKSNNPPNNGQEKPTTDVAPGFSETQFVKGQWIEWKKTGPDGSNECVRWVVADFFSDGVKLKGRTFRDCKPSDTYQVQHLLFNPQTGLVIVDQIVSPDATVTGPLQGQSIFPYIYGSKDKVEFLTGKQFKDGQKKEYYPAYQIKNRSSVYLNRPGTPFHAFVIQRKETKSGKIWTYSLHASSPLIETVTVKP